MKLVLALVLSLSFGVFAADATPTPTPDASKIVTSAQKTVEVVKPAVADSNTATVVPVSTEEVKDFVAALPDVKSVGVFGIVVAIVQLLVFALRTQLGAFAGAYRMLIITLLTWVLGLLSIKLTGADWTSAVLNSTNMVLIQSFGFQAFKQFTKISKETTPKA